MGYLGPLIICVLQHFPLPHTREDTVSLARQRTHTPGPTKRQTYHHNKTAHHQAAVRRGGQSRVLCAPVASTSLHLLSSPLPTWDRCTGTSESNPTQGSGSFSQSHTREMLCKQQGLPQNLGETLSPLLLPQFPHAFKKGRLQCNPGKGILRKGTGSVQ